MHIMPSTNAVLKLSISEMIRVIHKYKHKKSLILIRESNWLDLKLNYPYRLHICPYILRDKFCMLVCKTGMYALEPGSTKEICVRNVFKKNT